MALALRILGAGAGGGLPQWNCGCVNCLAARAGRIPPLTQSGLVVRGADGTHLVINASPDLRHQIAAAPELAPAGLRASPLKAVLLTSGEVDHVAGLLDLREKQPFTLYGTAEVLTVLDANPIFQALDPALVPRVAVAFGEVFMPVPGVRVELFPAPGKVPLWLEGPREETEVETGVESGQTAGVELSGPDGARVLYIPGCAHVPAPLAARIAGASVLLFDGTLHEDDEMIRLGLGSKTGARMGHMAMAGPGGSIAALSGIKVGRRVFVHINNSNPVLDPASAARRAVEAAGWEIGQDGMEIVA